MSLRWLITSCLTLACALLGHRAFADGQAAHPRPAPDWNAEPDRAESEFGTEIASGDFNGDGFVDVAVGAYTWSNSEWQQGAVFVYLGSRTGLSPTPARILEGDAPGLHFGRAIGTGDFNGDGYDDLVVGAPTFSNDPADGTTAMVFLYLGSPSGLGTSSAWVRRSLQHGDRFGRAVGTAGDVNGDGYEDLLIGAYFYDGSEHDEGEVWVFYGSPRGPSLEPDWEAEPDRAEAGFGWGAASAGDVNGDGYDDLIVGAPQFDFGKGYAGKAFLYLGSPSGLSLAPAWTADSPAVGASFARSVRGVGDVNGDGYDDVIVGARRLSRDGRRGKEGGAFVYLGGLSGLQAEPSWAAVGQEPGCLFGHAVGPAGDVDGDGYDDVIAGQPFTDGSSMPGRARIYRGGPGGLATWPAWTLEGDQPGASFGVWVTRAGDIDKDGLDDVLVGAWRYDNGETDEGRAYLYLGASLARVGPAGPPGKGVPSDYDGDGRADLLVRNPATGQTRLLLMAGSVVGGGGLVDIREDGSWHVDGAGDYNGDGRADILLRQRLTGEIRLRFMDGPVVAARATLAGPGPPWEIAATGDFDGDGQDDLLWRSRITGKLGLYLMHGSIVAEARRVIAVSGAEGQVAATGDFDGNGTSDLLFRNVVTGVVEVALMSGATITAHGTLGAMPVVAGTVDLDGDGRTDVVWQDPLTGAVRALLMNGTAPLAVIEIGSEPDPTWQIVGVADFESGGGRAILWRRVGTADLRLWHLEGASLRRVAAVEPIFPPAWEIENLRPVPRRN